METFVKLVIMRNLTVLNYEYFKFRKNGSEMVPFSKQHVYKRWKQESYAQESTALTLIVKSVVLEVAFYSSSCFAMYQKYSIFPQVTWDD